MLPLKFHTFPALKREYCGQPGLRFKNTSKTSSLLLITFELKSMACNKAWTVDLLDWKPYWCLFNKVRFLDFRVKKVIQWSEISETKTPAEVDPSCLFEKVWSMSEKMRFCNLVDFVIIFIKPLDKVKSINLLLLGFILTLRRSILLSIRMWVSKFWSDRKPNKLE